MKAIACTELRGDLVAYLDGEIGGSAAQAIHLHLRSCAACAALAENHRGAAELLSAWEPIAPRESMTAAILSAADALGATERSGGPHIRRRSVRVPLAFRWALVAAALLLVVTIIRFATRPNPAAPVGPSISDPVVQEIASDFELYDDLDDLLAADPDLDLLAADLYLDDDDDHEN